MFERICDALILACVAVFLGEWLARKVHEWAQILAFRLEMTTL